MSASNSPAYCEVDDVQEAMQEADEAMGQGPLAEANVEAAIHAASRWFRSAADAHFYDSNADPEDLVSTSPQSTTDRQLSVPSSPHPQRGQIRWTDKTRGNVQYPVTHAGPYCKVKLPKRHVESIDALRVRQRDGSVEDWVSASDKTEGRGDDWYFRTEGGASGRSHLYIHAASIGGREDFADLLEVDLAYGRDWDSNPWEDVKKGMAWVAAADLSTDSDVLTQIPDNGIIASIETQADRYLSIGMDRYLGAYLGDPVA